MTRESEVNSSETETPMTGKKLQVTSEIDAWCTKCKMDLTHRIIAMVGDLPKRVECRTCMTQHNYYKPKNGPAAEKKVRAPSRSGKSASPRAVAAAEAEAQRERNWEKQVSGKPPASFKPYRVSSSFSDNDLIHHTKFGDGFVFRVIDKAKIEVMFKDGPRTLAHGLTTN
jgi:hypothetical protein